MADRGDGALLRVRGLRQRYARRARALRGGRVVQALDGVDLDVEEGATLALVGESGSGKSTLARCLARLEDPEAGELAFDGVDLVRLRGSQLKAFRRKVQLVFQDPTRALNPRLSAFEVVGEPLLLLEGMSRPECEKRARTVMEQVGLLPEWGRKRPLELSGGQRQRLAIARALVVEPRLLILDEALSGLDPSVQAQIVSLLLGLKEARGLTLLLISHDLGLAAHVADRVAVMQAGRIVEEADASDLFRSPRHPYTQALLAALPRAAAVRPQS